MFLFRPSSAWFIKFIQNTPFVLKRIFHIKNPETGWLHVPDENPKRLGELRERFPIPFVAEWELKDEFYFRELIH